MVSAHTGVFDAHIGGFGTPYNYSRLGQDELDIWYFGLRTSESHWNRV